MKRNWRRKNYFIKKDLQGKYIFSFFIFVVAGSFIFSLIFGMMSADTMTIAYKDSSLQIGKTPVVLMKEMLGANWIFIVAGGFAVVVLSTFLTHRFAGPLFRLEKSVGEMVGGNFSFEIRLRSKDEAKELAGMVNDLNTMLSGRLREMRDMTDRMDDHLAHARESASDDGAAAELDRAITLNREVGKVLRGFKLKNDE